MTQETTTLTRQDAPATNQRKVFIKTYGCQMNVYDSERMGEALAADGYQPTEVIEDADLILLNTCHIREKAAEKVYSALGRYRELKISREREGRETLIGVAGCVAQAEGEEILRRAPDVNVVIGPQTYHRLPDALRRAKSGERVVDTEYAVEDKFDYLPKKERGSRPKNVSAFLTVQEGCDKFCTFCVVPYTRGAEISRSRKQIVDEARRLAENGVREITLLGQNVNAWHGEGPDGAEWGLGALLFDLAAVDGIDRLRYTTSHPRDMDEQLMAAHRELPELMPYLHLPVQAGSDRILKVMNRRHTAEEYLALIERIRAARPDIALSGDFIVGFPGETEEDFQATLDLVEKVRYAQAFSFKYSPRPGTPGAKLGGQVPEAEKSERLQRLQALLSRQQLEFAQSRIGMEMDILLEKPGRNPGQLVGRSPWLQSVVIDAGDAAVGDMVRVKVTDASANSLAAVRLG
ncbi:tRNA (N6-isopentenyl adenosine(37)-C2)-methylthiotransferase MiaB [Martelella mangrovi]|uniref:tRNA-2-methylthio-N(6)-dimethylallyladenosine synthase n=1 Tax=Martelella mangrovi TaxID=1397477 RepID=A0ABV2I956_9HYPH